MQPLEIGPCLPPKSIPALSAEQRRIVDDFHRLYYDNRKRMATSMINWFGYRMAKCPLDLWTYQEILCEQKPDVVIECGTFEGGSAFYLATLLEMLGNGLCVTIDIQPCQNGPRHDRLVYLTGSSVEEKTVAAVAEIVGGATNVLVILDSDHSQQHVERELDVYSRYIPVGGYLIVEDTNVNGHPAPWKFGPGPMEAVTAFLARSPQFAIDPARERFLMTQNPCGYLRRIS